MRALVLPFVLLLSGCAAGLTVSRNVVAPKVALGDLCTVRLVMTGLPSATGLVASRLKPALEKQLGLEVTERGDADAVLEVHVERWGIDDRDHTGTGEVITRHSEHLQAIFRLTRSNGTSLLTKEYFASARGEPQYFTSFTSREAADDYAAGPARGIVVQFLDDVVPRTRRERLAFVQDAELQPGLTLVEHGELPAAERSWRALNSAGAHYDLAVLLESRGEVKDALTEYEAAAARSPEPRYQQAVDAVRQSLALRRGCRR